MTAKLFLFALFVMSMLLMASRRRGRKRIVFFGDSITAQGNKSGGYIKWLQSFLATEELDEKYDLIGSGISGNKVPDLEKRMSADVLSRGAEIVVVFIGVNDVWHKQQNKGTTIEAFKESYTSIIEKFKAAEIKLLLCTPTSIGEKQYPQNEQDNDLEAYCNVIRELAFEHELPLTDLRKAFSQHSLFQNPENIAQGMLTTDGVHLNAAGNKLVAEQIWNSLSLMLK